MAVAGFLWQLFTDFRHALRQLRKNPGFSILAVLVLSLGIGANTAVFTVVDAVLLKPLAFADPDRIVSFTSAWPTQGTRAAVVSLPDAMDWRAGSSAFSALTYYRRSRRAVIVGDAASRESARAASFYRELFADLSTVPGVVAAGASTGMPGRVASGGSY
jgi:putative ABC transport system permease protein